MNVQFSLTREYQIRWITQIIKKNQMNHQSNLQFNTLMSNHEYITCYFRKINAWAETKLCNLYPPNFLPFFLKLGSEDIVFLRLSKHHVSIIRRLNICVEVTRSSWLVGLVRFENKFAKTILYIIGP